MDGRELRKRWRRLCASLGVYLSNPGEEFDALKKLYSRPPRAYHNLDHVGHCLEEFDRVSYLAENRGAVELAVWFHDAVYDPRSEKNEEASALCAASFCDRAGVLPEVREKAKGLILASKHMETPGALDAQIFVDVDLSILGQEPKAFWAYEKAIAEEYGWAPKDAFRRTRAEILARFLARPRIYSTRLFHDLYEKRARENLKASIEALGKGA